jgi:hypothetical protein
MTVDFFAAATMSLRLFEANYCALSGNLILGKYLIRVS